MDIAVLFNAPEPTIEVRDHGPGIAAEDRETVLRRFHRGANAADVPGSGVGLSIVMAILPSSLISHSS